jgi:hypothetical protein
MRIVVSALLSLCTLLLVVAIAMIVTPACLVIFSLNFGLGSCDDTETSIESRQSKLSENNLMEDRINELEKELLSINCPSEKVSALPAPLSKPNSINIEEWNQKKISFLKNCWELVGDNYQVSDIDDPAAITVYHTWKLCFDEKGNGVQSLTSTSNTCESPVLAEFSDDGSLKILDSENVSCSDGGYIYRREMSCSLDNFGKAKCRAYQPDSPDAQKGRSSFELVRTEK